MRETFMDISGESQMTTTNQGEKMETNIEIVKINGVDYVRADKAAQSAASLDGKPFVIVRSYGAGVFAGYVSERRVENGVAIAVLDRCIRLHRWTGCSLSQVANDGTAGTGENRFSMPVDGHEILQVIEVIPCTEKSRLAIQAVKTWRL